MPDGMLAKLATALRIGVSDQAGWMPGTAGQHGIKRIPSMNP